MGSGGLVVEAHIQSSRAGQGNKLLAESQYAPKAMVCTDTHKLGRKGKVPRPHQNKRMPGDDQSPQGPMCEAGTNLSDTIPAGISNDDARKHLKFFSQPIDLGFARTPRSSQSCSSKKEQVDGEQPHSCKGISPEQDKCSNHQWSTGHIAKA